MENVRRRCGFFNGINVPADGTRGSFSKNHIDVEIQEEEGNPRLRFMVFYGASDVRDKAATWDLLRCLGRNNLLPWFVGGDFNDIAFANEKQGGVLREDARMEAFHRTFKDCHLEDIGYFGTRAGKIKQRRDREVKRLTRRLEELNCFGRLEESLAELVDVKLHLNMEMDKEERYWEQRARVNWLKMRDKNTSFFHKFASQRRRTNRIRGLQRSDDCTG
ncbi:5'-nucleotidase surE [Gossypium australe]|uniref:5'-nucleotidase surE n=1 Tax=Gossypium australe TaxID=47621 RepID=A0A5B6VB88_9ROSI|nr:5'-nucleotidase surE [Gossypium australe]